MQLPHILILWTKDYAVDILLPNTHFCLTAIFAIESISKPISHVNEFLSQARPHKTTNTLICAFVHLYPTKPYM
ncbi:hypothetical protein EUGRSUZ_E03532 [Eucalyptus grandis]|uniref:Uncharacterized protein n=2 Tax=Eucalyptus grandis TaxID=71139 RepID=A0ACC3LE96_EUCGR|nr:hypothetical protein EUGRSUZ_E03532 [Eucalyptus grandis]